IHERELRRLVLYGSRRRENAAKGSKEKRHKQVNENRRKKRQQNRSRLVFVIPNAFGVARLGEHNVSRRHESGFSVVRKNWPWAFLSLRLEHYLSPRVLTTCTEGPTPWLALFLSFVHSRIYPYCHSER